MNSVDSRVQLFFKRNAMCCNLTKPLSFPACISSGVKKVQWIFVFILLETLKHDSSSQIFSQIFLFQDIVSELFDYIVYLYTIRFLLFEPWPCYLSIMRLDKITVLQQNEDFCVTAGHFQSSTNQLAISWVEQSQWVYLV